MNITSKQLSDRLSVSERHIRNLSKKAIEKGLAYIECKGKTFTFTLVSTPETMGKAYAYAPLTKTAIKHKRKVKSKTALNPNDLPVIASLNKPTTDEKVALVCFYNTENHPVSVIAQALIIEHCADIKHDSLVNKIKRWVRTYKNKGREGLEDKRGGKAFKADLELVRSAIYAGGTRHYHSLYLIYCQLYAKRHNLTVDSFNLSSDISESAFIRSVKHLINTDDAIKQFRMIGQDAHRYAQPSFGNVWSYPNQQWEVDATPLDLMVKIPLDEHGNKDFHSRDTSADFEVVDLSKKSNTNSRVTLTRVIDNFSKASVHMITQSSNSYANARLLYKAFSILGMPETIRSDQGSDYISEHMQSSIESLGINSIILPPASGDQKGTIERSFRTLQHSAHFENLPGFIGHNVNQRQHLENEASTKRDKKSNVATNIKGDFMWHWQAEEWIDNYLKKVDADKYAMHENGLSNNELENVFRLLGKAYSRKVTKSGIRHNKTYYLDNELWAKHFVIGESLQIRENMNDTTKLFVFKIKIFSCKVKPSSNQETHKKPIKNAW